MTARLWIDPTRLFLQRVAAGKDFHAYLWALNLAKVAQLFGERIENVRLIEKAVLESVHDVISGIDLRLDDASSVGVGDDARRFLQYALQALVAHIIVSDVKKARRFPTRTRINLM